MADITPIDHVSAALARVIDQFSNSPKVQALIALPAEVLQDAETSLAQLQGGRWLDTAVGAQLDTLGAIVGQPRESRGDVTYRLWIQARMLANRSTGTYDDTLRILQLLAPDTLSTVLEVPPAAYVVRVYGIDAPALELYNIIAQAKPAGVRMNLESSPFEATELFSFAPGDTDEILDANTGWGNDAETTGGHFVDVI
jgi:hypothetical protein